MIDSEQRRDEALAYANTLGWHIFPVWPMRDGACACGTPDCGNAGKHPITKLVPQGHLNASNDPAAVRRWWTQFPDANIGLWCAKSDVVVVDIDPRNGGDAAWASLQLPDSPVAADTGGGGTHQFYCPPEDEWSGAKLQGIDLKFNGYVILPPSNHKSGGAYSWRAGCDPEVFFGLGEELPDLPDCFICTVGSDAAPSADRVGLSLDDSRNVLEQLADYDCEFWFVRREGWFQALQAMHHEHGAEGLPLFDELCEQYSGEAYNRRELAGQWKSLDRRRPDRPVTMRTLMMAAKEARALSQFDDVEDADDTTDTLDIDALIGGAADPDDFDSIINSATAPSRDWLTLLDFNEEGAIRPTCHNITLIVANDPRLAGVPQLNEFTQEIVQRTSPGTQPDRRQNQAKPTLQLSGPIWNVTDRLNGVLWSDDRDFAIRRLLEAPKTQGGYGIKVSDRDLKLAITLAANNQRFHPVREYFDGLKWDGRQRVERLFVDYFHAEENAYTLSVARLMILGAITRIYEPGAKFDFAVVLEGIQGKRKSTFIEILARHWFAELDGDFHDPRGMIELMQGALILELPELTGFQRADVRAIKAFISRKKDKARLAYARRAGEFPRQCIFIGSTNDREYLKDDTGGRRFWPMPCNAPSIDTDRLEREVDQLWAEGVQMYRQLRRDKPTGALPLYLTDPEAQRIAARLQESRRMESSDEGKAGAIAEWLDAPLNDGGFVEEGEQPRYRDRVCLLEIFVECERNDIRAYGQAQAQALGRAMTRVRGWEQVGIERNGMYGRQRTYRRICSRLDVSAPASLIG